MQDSRVKTRKHEENKESATDSRLKDNECFSEINAGYHVTLPWGVCNKPTVRMSDFV